MDIINYRNPVIYQILNIKNNHSYIGSSDQFVRRQKAHRNDLRKVKHHSRYLQRAWNKYGEDQFTVIILETVLFRELLEVREQYWIDKLKPQYNMAKCVSASMTGQRHTEESKKKMSLTRLGRKFSPIHRKRIKEALTKEPRFSKEFLIDEYINKGKTIRQIEKENGLTKQSLYIDMDKYGINRRNKSEAATLAHESHSPEVRKLRSEKQRGPNNHNYGRDFSAETRRKMSESAKHRWASAVL